MFCSKCGNSVDPSSRFCPACGTSISAAPPPPPGNYPNPGQLTRPRNNRMIAGVCAAFAQQYGWDLTVVRIVTAIICLSGAGAFAYLIAWIIIPDEPYAVPNNGL